VSYLDRIRECNSYDPSRYVAFRVGAARVGEVRRDLARRLETFTEVFDVGAEGVIMKPELADFDRRSAAMETVLKTLAAEGVVTGWRDECYSVKVAHDAAPLLKMERAAASAFGVTAFEVHVNGFVDGKDGLELWIARRHRDKPTYPSLLDCIAAGGVPHGAGVRETALKEMAEEAGIPAKIGRRARSVGTLSYRTDQPQGLRNDVLFTFDIEIPADFTPQNTDGEVEAFTLWPVERVARCVAETREFMFNTNLVIIDFLIRHGVITPAHADYAAIVKRLRQ
jgi:8-oxo-dGTP pyrophosphatase MutT (NUDIX family)